MAVVISAKDKARNWVRDGVRRGTIVKPFKCSKCGNDTEPAKLSHHHHRGYDYYRDYQWLCAACHAFSENRPPARPKRPWLSDAEYAKAHPGWTPPKRRGSA